MGLTKGQTNNPNGRPKGSGNRLNKTTREFLNDFLKRNRSKLQKDWNSLEPFQRVTLFEKFLAYSIPKMSSIEIEKLTDEQLDEIIKTITKNNTNG